MLSLTAFSDELEREKARQRTYDAMLRKARAGHVTGGRVFGYDNIEVCTATGERSHVTRQINAEEAAIVRRIFSLCTEGAGLTRITKALNEDRAPAPRAQQGRPHAWAGSSVRAVLRRPLYRGAIVWNQTRKRDRWGLAKRSDKPMSDRIQIDAPELRVVSDDLWTRAQAQCRERQRKHGGGAGRRRDLEWSICQPRCRPQRDYQSRTGAWVACSERLRRRQAVPRPPGDHRPAVVVKFAAAPFRRIPLRPDAYRN